MRIDDARRREIDNNRRRTNATHMTGSASATMFSSLLEIEEKKNSNYQYELEELRDEIYKAGEELERDPSIEEYNHFRDLIRSLTERVSREAYRIEIVGSFRKKHSVVATVNEELNSLYKEIIKEQKNHMAITNKIVRLKGLVIDILS